MEEEGEESGANAVDVAAEVGERRPTIADLPPEAVRLLPGEMRRHRRGSYVYFLFNGDECVYIGKTAKLLSRVFEHAKSKAFGDVYFLECGDDRGEIEAHWIRALRPRLNVILFAPPKVRRLQRGRPPKRPEDRRQNRLVIKLTDDERQLMEAAAGGDGVTVWARDILVRAAKRAVK